jgi:drug/metabolite transporter (DMT)-like permease
VILALPGDRTPAAVIGVSVTSRWPERAPAVALAIGWLLVDEPITALDALAVLLILAGVVALRARPAAG